ncbi:hypothetical protein ACNI3Q_04655 [Sphingomonas sp. FW199]|uniref:hypothetical protein n=1 Tax=unclassified Sphingomonas TaxID=196159 RepID=UPI0021A724C6|nr:hypothetical protein [Sphingomonas sp. BGYR3]MDG5488421.1 hypothetical protein [Sphingomonas sp. BGYR3]
MSDDGPEGPMPTLFAAIVRRQCVTATYNKGEVLLAPHILYTKHGVPYLDAVTVLRDGNIPREEKLGAFKVDGLGDIRLSDRAFDMSRLYDAHSDKYAGVTLLSVEG